MIRDRYRFTLQVNDSPPVDVFPDWSNGHERATAREADRRFYRNKIDEPYTFRGGVGYSLVMEADIEDSFTFTVYERNAAGERVYYVGEFNKTDTEPNEDTSSLEFTTRPDDEYSAYLDNEDTEYNLVELASATTKVSYEIYPTLQLVVKGADVVVNIQPGLVTSVQVEPVDIVNAITWGDLNFGTPTRIAYIAPQAGLSPDVSGVYLGSGVSETGSYVRDDGAYRINFDLDVNNNVGTWTIRDVVGSVDVFTAANAPTRSPGFDSSGLPDFTDGGSQRVRVFGLDLFARVLTREGSFDGIQATAIVEGDQYARGTSYRNTVAYQVAELIASTQTAESSQGLGKYVANALGDQAGEFIARLSNPSSNTTPMVPLASNQWQEVAWWFYVTPELNDKLEAQAEVVELADAYSLEDTVNGLLGEIAPEVTFSASSASSELLYGATDPITGQAPYTYLVVPKSNILVFNYDTPDPDAPIKMADLVEFFRNAMQAEVFIEGGRLRVEHISYFEKGGSYDVEPSVGFDATTQVHPQTKRPWAYFTNSYSYDKSVLPARIITKWQDEQSDLFDGQDIVVVSRYVDRSAKEERPVASFSTDIQLATTTPGAFADDGFFILACEQDEGGNLVVAKVLQPSGLTVQNGALTWPYLHSAYYRHNLPALRVRINGEEVTAITTRPSRKQEISVPLPSDFNVFSLIRTGIGDGIIESYTLNKETGVAEVTLLHGTD
jgi:hypothetical protein